MKREVKKKESVVFVFAFAILFSLSFASAGIGIKWSQESAMVNEGDTACLTYSVYNPWSEETYATIGLSEELLGILTMQDVNAKLIPAETSSAEAIPIEFCFKVPSIYEKDCSVGNFICKQECSEEMKVYEGDVVVSTVPAPTQIGGTGGSSTQMAVSAPLRIRVKCNPYPRDYSLIYIIIAVISALVVFMVLFKRYRKPKTQRDKERLAKLKAEIAREEGKKSVKKKTSKKKK